MSEVREVLERTFSTEVNAHAITLAALWLSTHDDVDVDSIVGDADYVMVYYTQQKQIAKGAVADATEYFGPFRVPEDIPISYLGRAG